jgi:predicted GNAT family N-acyltransferase
MAVLQAMRGSGVGRAVLDALMGPRARGDREVLLHAQAQAAPFYQRAGFQPRGPAFDEAGIPHVEMGSRRRRPRRRRPRPRRRSAPAAR